MKSNRTVTLLCALMFGAGTLAAAQQHHPELSQQPEIVSASQATNMSNAEVRHEIQARLDTNATLNGGYVAVMVTDDSVALTGYVVNEQQRAFASIIAQSYGGDRRLLNNIEVGGFPGW